MHVGCSMERGRHGGKAEGRRVRNRPCDVAHRSEVCGSRTLLGPCVASSSLGICCMVPVGRWGLARSWGRAWQHREVPSPVRAYPCLCRSEPQVRIIPQNAPCAFQNKVGDQHDASSPNHEGLYMYYRTGRRCGLWPFQHAVRYKTRRRACSIQRSDSSSSGRSDIASRSTCFQGRGWRTMEVRTKLAGGSVQHRTGLSSVPF
jgi:hypothetical protein